MPDRAVIEDQAPSLELPDAVATLDMIKITAADNDLINIAIHMREFGETARPYKREDLIRFQIGLGKMKRLEIDFCGGVILVDEINENIAVQVLSAREGLTHKSANSAGNLGNRFVAGKLTIPTVFPKCRREDAIVYTIGAAGITTAQIPYLLLRDKAL